MVPLVGPSARARSLPARLLATSLATALGAGCGLMETRTTEGARLNGINPDAKGDFFGPPFFSGVAFDVLVFGNAIEHGFVTNGALECCSPCTVGPMLISPFIFAFDIFFDVVLLPADLIAWPMGYRRPWPEEQLKNIRRWKTEEAPPKQAPVPRAPTQEPPPSPPPAKTG